MNYANGKIAPSLAGWIIKTGALGAGLCWLGVPVKFVIWGFIGLQALPAITAFLMVDTLLRLCCGTSLIGSIFKRNKDAGKSKFSKTLEKEYKELAQAARVGDIEVIDALLKEHPILATERDESGMTALHWAAYAGETEAVARLLELDPAGKNSVDNLGNTPLIYATMNRYVYTIDALLKHLSVDEINHQNKAGISAPVYAQRNQMRQIDEALAEKTPRVLTAGPISAFPVKVTLAFDKARVPLEAADPAPVKICAPVILKLIISNG